MTSPKFEDVVNARISAEFRHIARKSAERLRRCALDAQERGLGDEFALAMSVEAKRENIRATADWLYTTFATIEPAASENLEQVADTLKRIARSILGSHGEFPNIRQAADRAGIGSVDFVNALCDQLAAEQAAVLREIDSRIDALMYKYSTRASSNDFDAAKINRASQKLKSQKRRSKWNEEGNALRLSNPTMTIEEISRHIASGPLGLMENGRRYRPETIRRQLNLRPEGPR